MPSSWNDESIFDGIALGDEVLSFTVLAHRTEFALEEALQRRIHQLEHGWGPRRLMT